MTMPNFKKARKHKLFMCRNRGKNRIAGGPRFTQHSSLFWGGEANTVRSVLGFSMLELGDMLFRLLIVKKEEYEVNAVSGPVAGVCSGQSTVRYDPAGGAGEPARGQPESVLGCGSGCGAIWVGAARRLPPPSPVPLPGRVRSGINRRRLRPATPAEPARPGCFPARRPGCQPEWFRFLLALGLVSRHPIGRPGPGKGAQKAQGHSSGAAQPCRAGWMDRAAPGSGAGSLPLLLALALGLVVLHCVVADGNSTRSPEINGLLCRDPEENCTAATTQPKRKGHFSRCPRQYKHYCIKGKCRFVVAEQTPSCVCDDGYTGARCERVDLFYQRGDRRQTLVICLMVVMVIFIIVVVSVCVCCHPRQKCRKRRKKEEEMETLGKDITPINQDVQETNIA
ncbi:probetacellulin [Eulemur rufifrons]|uniref:probetacellulin n=1 Tax=Eulemur rufifrons TaxID=859984 RepID=UPI003743BBBF